MNINYIRSYLEAKHRNIALHVERPTPANPKGVLCYIDKATHCVVPPPPRCPATYQAALKEGIEPRLGKSVRCITTWLVSHEVPYTQVIIPAATPKMLGATHIVKNSFADWYAISFIVSNKNIRLFSASNYKLGADNGAGRQYITVFVRYKAARASVRLNKAELLYHAGMALLGHGEHKAAMNTIITRFAPAPLKVTPKEVIEQYGLDQFASIDTEVPFGVG